MTELETLTAALNENYRNFLWGSYLGFEVVDEIEGDDRRWYRDIQVILRGPSGDHYSFGYDKGLTEMQDDEYYGDAPIRVSREVETVEVVKWIRV